MSSMLRSVANSEGEFQFRRALDLNGLRGGAGAGCHKGGARSGLQGGYSGGRRQQRADVGLIVIDHERPASTQAMSQGNSK